MTPSQNSRKGVCEHRCIAKRAAHALPAVKFWHRQGQVWDQMWDRCRFKFRTVPGTSGAIFLECYRYKGLAFPERALDDRAGMVPYGTGHRGSEVVRRAKIFSPGKSSRPSQGMPEPCSEDATIFAMSLTGTGVGSDLGQV